MNEKETDLDIEIEELMWLSREALEEDIDIIRADIDDTIKLIREEMRESIREVEKDYAEELEADIAALKAAFNGGD